METLRLTFLMEIMGKTGGNRVLLNFIQQLDKLGHEVRIVTGRPDTWFPLSSRVQVIRLPVLHSYWRLARELRLKWAPTPAQIAHHWEVFRRNLPKADLNVATFWTTAYPCASVADSTAPVHHIQHFETLFSNDLWSRALTRWSYQLPIYRIANSTWLRDRIHDLTGASPPVLVPGIEHDIFYPRGGRSDDRKDLQVVALAKRGWKNLDTIIDAVRGANRTLQGETRVTLNLFSAWKIGDLPQDDFIRLHWNLSDAGLAELYSRSHIQVTASLAESSPLPPLEAMACGCTVVTTPAGSEDYCHDGVNCLTFAPGETAALQERIVRLARDPALRERLSRAGIETAKGLSYERQAQSLVGLLQDARGTWSANKSRTEASFAKYKVPLYA